MKKQYKRNSLSNRISIMIIMIIFTIIGSFAFVLYRYFQQTIEEHVIKVVETTTAVNEEMVEHLLRRIEISCTSVHDSNFIYTTTPNAESESPISKLIMEYTPENPVSSLKTYDMNVEQFNNYFKSCFGDTDSYHNIFFIDSAWPIHKVMQSKTLENMVNGFTNDLLVKKESWYQKALSTEDEAYWFVEENSNQICMAKRLTYRYAEENYNIKEYMLGVIAVKFDLSAIYGNLDLDSLTQDTKVVLFNSDKNIIYANRLDVDQSFLITVLEKSNQNVKTDIWLDGANYYVRLKEMPLGLNMLTLVPNQDVYQMAAQTIRIIIILGIVMICLAVFITIYLSKTIFKPLHEFTEYMEKGTMEQFYFDHRRKDEIGILYRAYNHLMKNLDESLKRELAASEEKKQVELKALQMQINPHFIYNTLNSISCLAIMKGQADIVELISNLNRSVRYYISAPLKHVCIEDEIEMIRQYESIQKHCFRNRFFIEYEVMEETKLLMIPKLIIQPLIENALMYGMDLQTNTIRIKLQIYLEEDNLFITVVDSGINADIELINQYAKGKIEYISGSLGVRNVYERIVIAYGTEAGLIYKHDEEHHTVATIYIPRKKMKTYIN